MSALDTTDAKVAAEAEFLTLDALVASVGGSAVLPAPILQPPAQSLLTAATVVDLTDERWLRGATFSPESCIPAEVLDAYCPSSDAKGTGNTRNPNRLFSPFVVIQRDECSTYGFQSAEYQDRARRALLVHEPKAIEREFWTGTLNSDNPHLAQPNATDFPLTTLAGGAAQTAKLALALLNQAISDAGAGRGMIHASPLLVEIWSGQSALLRYEGGKLLTANGNIVVPGDGYPGTSPTGTGGGITAATQWAYATDPVVVLRGPITVTPDTIAEATDRLHNVVSFRAERAVSVLWNGCCHAAVNVTIA